MYRHLHPALAHERTAGLRAAASATRGGQRRDRAIERPQSRITAVSRLRRLITPAP